MAMQRGGPPPPPGPLPPKGTKARGGPAPPTKTNSPAKKPSAQATSGPQGMDGVLGQLTGKIGAPKESSKGSNPSFSVRPGYKAPEGLPEGGGTLGTEKCFWNLAGPQVAQVSTEVIFKLICKNEQKELHDIPVTLLETELWRHDNKEKTTVRGKITKSTTEKGRFDVIFRPHHPGDHVFQIWVKGELEKKGIYKDGDLPKLKVIKEPTLTTEEIHFTAQGHGWHGGQVGKESTFEIFAKNPQGELEDVPDESKLTICITHGIKTMTGFIQRMNVGHYQADYTPWGPGEFDVVVQYGKHEVIRKKITFTFGIDAAKTTIIGAPEKVTVGKQASFVIQAKSQMGHNINYGGQKFDCAVSGPPKGVTGLVVRDETNGTYTTRFTLIAEGSYKFFVKLGGIPLAGTPFVIIAEN